MTYAEVIVALQEWLSFHYSAAEGVSKMCYTLFGEKVDADELIDDKLETIRKALEEVIA